MNKEDVIEFVNEEKQEFAYGGQFKEELNGWDYTIEEDVGGEGEGDHAHVVLLFSRGNESFFLKIDGYYSSWDGTEWGEVYEVTPYEKTVRDWKKA